MSTTLSRGFKRPDTGDRGTSWFQDLSDDITQLNSHTHNGIDSEKVNVSAIVKQSQTLLNSAWGADLGGSTYKQSVTMPAGLVFTDSQITFINVTGANLGTTIYPTVNQTGVSAFDVLVNDNTMTVRVVYG